jgi:hypothetical protein
MQSGQASNSAEANAGVPYRLRPAFSSMLSPEQKEAHLQARVYPAMRTRVSSGDLDSQSSFPLDFAMN